MIERFQKYKRRFREVLLKGWISFEKYKKCRLHVDKDIFKIAWCNGKKEKLQKILWKLPECIGEPQDSWKAIKLLELLNKSGRCIVGALTENKIVKHDTKSTLKKL